MGGGGRVKLNPTLAVLAAIYDRTHGKNYRVQASSGPAIVLV